MEIEKWCEENNPTKFSQSSNPVTNEIEGGVFVNALALKTDANQAPLSSSLQEQCTGCMILMNMAMQASGYNPLDPYAAQNQKNFDKFLQILSSCPLFSIEFSESTHYSLQSKNADQLVDEISSICNAGEEKDVKQVKESLKKLVKSAFSHAKQEQRESYFVQGTICVNGKITYTNNLCSLSLISEEKKGGTITSDTTDIKRIRLEFYGDLWDKYKEKFDPKFASSIDEWAQKYSTPTGPKKVALTCFRRGH